MASLKNFMVGAVIIGFFIYFVFILWTVIGSVLYDPSGGLVTELDEMAQKDMTGEFLDNWNEHHDNDANSFGFIGLLVMGVLFLVLIILAFKKKSQSEE